MKFLKIYEDFLDGILPDDYEDLEGAEDYTNAIDTMTDKIESGEIDEEDVKKGKKLANKIKSGEGISDDEFDYGLGMADKLDPEMNQQHMQAAIEHVAQAIESGEIEGTIEEVEDILREMVGMRIPFSDTKADGNFAEEMFNQLIGKFAKIILSGAKKQITE